MRSEVLRNFKFSCSMFFAALLLFVACENDDDEKNDEVEVSDEWSGTGPYGIVSYVGKSYFLGVLGSLNAGTYNQGNAVEVDNMYSLNYFNGKIYFPPHYAQGGTELKVFGVNANNTLTLEDTLTVPAGAGALPIYFISATRAYMSLLVSGYIWEFNPATLEVINKIDLRSYAVGSSDSADDDNSPEPAGMVSKNNMLYVAFYQAYNSLQMGRDVAQVAVINMDTNEVETVITDSDRGFSMPGSYALSNQDGMMFIDENGDVYVNCTGGWGWVEGQKAGYLRIDTTTNTFDAEWEIDFSNITLDVAGGKIDYIMRAVYVGDGVVYGVAHVPGAESDPVDWVNDRIMSYVKVDVWNQTLEALPLPATSMYGAALTLDGDYLVMSEYTDQGTSLYVYDTVSETVVGSPAVTTEGSVMLIQKLE